ncbi:MAG: hypothetical protein A2252_01055 [Elusimicrobia bacterium RIFOXYA2_FULL_39_19]|nr:MAG: hypothetical protein A2252_01055 [Elusimicrobia bacterium RIFOXYA2_FULL_39_19]
MATLKISLVLVFLVFWTRKKMDLGLGLFICGIALGLTALPWLNVLTTILQSTYKWETIDLLLSLLLIFYFIEIWSTSGGTKNLTTHLNSVLRNSPIALVIPPAIIGLIPIIGGAMVSAPLVKDSQYSKHTSPAKLTFQNYWFRHIWEYCMPTYPGVILSASLLGLSFGQIFMLNFPLTIAAIIAGLVFGLSGIKYDKKERPEKVNMEGMKYFLYAIIPLLVIIVLALVFKVPVYLAIIISIIFMALANKSGLHAMYKMFIKSFSFTIVSVVLGIMSFKAVMENSGIISQMSAEFISWHIPVMLLLFILPFLTALITGLTQPFVAIAFPLLMTYLSNDHSLLTWAYASGYMGVLLSPVHYCLVLTREYFKASWKDVYKILIIPCAIVLATAYVVVKLRG